MNAPASIEALLASLQPREAASHDFRPRAFRAWVADLPLANAAETGRRIHAALLEMNRTRLPADERLELLRLLERPVEDVTAAVCRHFVGRPLPLPERGRKAARVAIELARQMALGFELAAREAARGRGSRLAASAAHGALEQLGRALLAAYQAYAPPPPGLWRSLHRVYGLAEAHGLAALPVGSPGRRATDATATAGAAYKRLLLLSLACPYRMRQGEVRAVYDALAEWAVDARLEPLGDPLAQEGLFVVHLDSDAPPCYRALDRAACTPASCRVLDAAPLGERLRTALSSLREEGDEPRMAAGGRLTAPLLRKLALSWGVMPRRGFARAASRTPADVLVGLSAIHQRLRRERAPATEKGAETPPQPVPGIEAVISGRARFETGAPGDGGVPDVWDLAFDAAPPSGSPRMVLIEEERHGRGPEPEPEPELPTHRCRLEDISPGGYRIHCDRGGESGLQIQVGELLAVREEGEARWRLAAVRWAKCASAGKLDVGVQVLFPDAEPGYARRQEPGAPWVPVLIVPEVPSVQQPASVLAPPFALRHAETVSLRDLKGTAREVQLTRTVENTGCFAHYHYAPTERKGGGTSSGEEDLDSLWEAL